MGSSIVPPGSTPGCGERVTIKRTLDSGRGMIRIWVRFRGLGMQMHLRLDVAGTGGIDRGPDPLPGPGKCACELAAEREVWSRKARRRSSRDPRRAGLLARAELLDAAAGLDLGPARCFRSHL